MPIRRTSNRSSYDSGFYNPEVYSDVGSRLLAFDADALVYINAVEAADGQALEAGVRSAYNNFVLGCKSDGIWNAIKASCIMAGARTLSGALTPLAGVRPSGFNFVAGDYNRRTGLVGNGSSKYLDSNRNNNADPQNSKHIAVFITSPATIPATFISTTAVNVSGDSYLFQNSPTQEATYKVNALGAQGASGVARNLFGASRASSTSVDVRLNGANLVSPVSSVVPFSQNLRIYGTVGIYANSRLSFYSIGESLDLSLLEARVSGLMVSISGAVV